MVLHSSGEDYLKAILILQKEKGAVRSVDVSEYMGVSKPSVSHAMKTLRDGDFLYMDDDRYLHLTDAGRVIAENLYERYQYFAKHLAGAGLILHLQRKKPARWNTQSAMNRSMS